VLLPSSPLSSPLLSSPLLSPPQLMADLYDQILPHFDSTCLGVAAEVSPEFGMEGGRATQAIKEHGLEEVYLSYLLALQVHPIVTPMNAVLTPF